MKKSAHVFLLLASAVLGQHKVLQLRTLAQSDTTPPLTTATLSGTQGLNDWYTSGVNVDLVADDLESGVHSIFWKLDPPEADWQMEEFLGTLNRIQNPSFESGGLFYIDNWDYPWVWPWEAVFLRSWHSKFGSRSARITVFADSYYYWHNRTYYSATEASRTYTATTWVKTEALAGDGAYAAAWGRDTDGSDGLITETSKISGTQDWARVSVSFTMPDGYDGVFLRLGANGGWGSVWFDGVSLYEEEETGVSFAVGESGEHTLEYYAVDNAGNEETPHKTIDFKIDTSAPSSWRNFEATQTLNNHTFVCGIDVSDLTSGLDVSTAAYQYTYDGGATWSDWLTDLTVDPGVDGSETVRLTTGDVDFHNSNWEVGKVIRFRISDLASLEGVSPDQNLFGAWMMTTGGDVYAGGNISMNASGPDPGAEGVIVTTGSQIENFSAAQNWTVKSYPPILRMTYDEWLEKFPTTTPLPYGRLPLESGRYFAGGGDFVIDNQTIPGGPGPDLASTENLAAVIFVGGDLIVSSDLEVHPTSVLLFIVGGDVRVDKGVEKLDASFLPDGTFDTSYNGSPPQKQLVVKGLVAANQVVLRRGLVGNGNLTEPAEVFEYQAKIINLAPYIGEGAISWVER